MTLTTKNPMAATSTAHSQRFCTPRLPSVASSERIIHSPFSYLRQQLPKPGSTDRTKQMGMRARLAQGGDEHARERTRRCVTERAQETTPGSAASEPEMLARAGGFGLQAVTRTRRRAPVGA